ncbi:hypothetical protein V8C42DRAFT_179139 [Trichoderma barbatum]
MDKVCVYNDPCPQGWDPAPHNLPQHQAWPPKAAGHSLSDAAMQDWLSIFATDFRRLARMLPGPLWRLCRHSRFNGSPRCLLNRISTRRAQPGTQCNGGRGPLLLSPLSLSVHVKASSNHDIELEKRAIGNAGCSQCRRPAHHCCGFSGPVLHGLMALTVT